MTPEPSLQDLLENHRFVSAWEQLRKRFGVLKMDDAALQFVASRTGLTYAFLKKARRLRNALAHDQPVQRSELWEAYGELLPHVTVPDHAPEATDTPVPLLPSSNAIRVHAWKDARLEQRMLANGFIAIGGAEIGDVTGLAPEDIRQILTATMPDKAPKAISLFVGYWKRFLGGPIGTCIVLPRTDKKSFALGEIVSAYYYVAETEEHARHRREVSWSFDDVPKAVLSADLLKVLHGHHTVQDFKDADAAEGLREAAAAAGGA